MNAIALRDFRIRAPRSPAVYTSPCLMAKKLMLPERSWSRIDAAADLAGLVESPAQPASARADGDSARVTSMPPFPSERI